MICIDPGVRACGLAFFSSDKELIYARYVLVSELRDQVANSPLLIEMPRIYPGSAQQKGDLNDLLDLAAVVGYCEALFGVGERVFPARWKGQVPKKIMTARIISKLTPDELSRIARVGAKDHNTIDAVGIGLWKLGRLG